MKRIYHHHNDLEEYAAGMWSTVTGVDREYYIQQAADLMRHPEKFKTAMRRALKEWPNSCEATMTAQAINHQAWLGHAGCFLATGSPEETTRLGWHRLSMEQQVEANRAADTVIIEWEEAHNGSLFSA